MCSQKRGTSLQFLKNGSAVLIQHLSSISCEPLLEDSSNNKLSRENIEKLSHLSAAGFVRRGQDPGVEFSTFIFLTSFLTHTILTSTFKYI